MQAPPHHHQPQQRFQEQGASLQSYAEGRSSPISFAGSREVKEAHGGDPTKCHHHSSVGGKGGCHGTLGAAFPLMMLGLAAMICLLFISFGVLLCCYYKLLTTLERRPSQALIQAQQSDHNDDVVKGGDGTLAEEGATSCKEVVVIMAGKNTPTFIALPTIAQLQLTEEQVSKDMSTKKHGLSIPPT
ncbi:hypothetical protein L7F22_025026 [Adiantum nelumboides]|nr:hypothetical protein [Adiantum nelumboides]